MWRSRIFFRFILVITLLFLATSCEVKKPLRDSLPIQLVDALNQAESSGKQFDVMFEIRVPSVEGQKDLNDENWGLIALSTNEILIASQGENVSPAFPGSFVIVALSEVSVDPVKELSAEGLSIETIGFDVGYRVKTINKEAIYRIKTEQGHLIFVAMRVSDMQILRRKLAGNE